MANYSLCNYTNGTGYTEVTDQKSQDFVDVVQGYVRRRLNFATFLAAAGISINATSDKIALLTTSQGNLLCLAYIAVLQNDAMTDPGGGTGTTCTVALGDDSAPTGFVASFDLGPLNVAPAANVYQANKLYMATGGSAVTVQILGTGTSTNPKRPMTAVIEVGASIMDILPVLRSKMFSLGLVSREF